MRSIIKWVLFIFLMFGIERFCHKQTHGFRPHKILTTRTERFPNTLSTDEEIDRLKEIFSKPFYFLNSGGESYAFVSSDQQYVIKFFKQHHMREKSWEDYFVPKSIREKLRSHRLFRFNRFYTSCSLAQERFKEETALVYLHLSQTNDFKKPLKIYDAIGAVHYLKLDDIDFALQKKVSLALPTLQWLIENKESEKAKERLSSLVHLIMNRCQRGIADHDVQNRNFGFLGSKAIELDLGSFTVNENLKNPQEAKKVLLYETTSLRNWLKKKDSQLYDFLDNKIENILNNDE